MNTLRRSTTLPLATLGLLVACAGNGPTPPPQGITVSGLVQDAHAEPISGATVLVGKRSVTSGPDGTFSIPGVVVPYDITAILPTQNAAVIYKGLTRSDPVLLYPDVTGAERTATISGTAPPAPGSVTAAHFASSGRHALGVGRADATTGQYAFAVRWHGSYDTDAGQLYLLRWTTDATGLPTSYDGYASRPLTIMAGGDFSGNDFAAAELTDPPEQSISGAITVPASYTLNVRQLIIDIARVGFYWEEKNAPSNAFTYTVPAQSGLAFTVAAQAVDGSSRWSAFFKEGISGNTSNVSVPLAAAPQLALPANGASGVDATTPFSWSQGGGTGVNLFKVWPGNSTSPTYFVFTTGADAKIPDLAGEGMGLPAGASYYWHLDRVFPVASVDAAAGESFRRLIGDADGGDVGETVSERFGFTTKTAAGTPVAAATTGPGAAAAGGPQHRGLVMRAPILAGPR